MAELPPGFVLDGAAPARGPVYGPPPKAAPAPTPFQVEDQTFQRTQQQREGVKFDQQQREWDATHNPDGTKKIDTTPDKLQLINPTAAGGIQENLKTLRGVDAALAALNARPESIGPGTGFLGDTFTQFNDPNGTETRSNVGRVGAYTIHDLSGAAVSASEAPRFKPFVPAVTDRPEVARQKLEGFRKELQASIKESLDFYTPTNGYRPYVTPETQAFSQGATQGDQQAPPAFAPQTSPAPQDAPPAPTGQIPGVGMDNGGGGGQQLATGGFEQVDDPALKGVRDEYRARLQRGDSPSQIVQWARSAGITDPGALKSIAAQAVYRARNPKVPIEQYDTSELDDRYVPLSSADQMLNSVAQSDIGAGAIAAGDAASGFTLDNIIGATGGNAERARLGMNAIADAHPKSNLAGTVGGGMLSALAMEGVGGLAGATGVARTLGADAAYGAVAGAGGTDYGANGAPASMGERAVGAGKGTLASLIGSGAGNIAAKGARGVADASVQTLRDVGVPMTLGQMVGRSGKVGAMVKGAEDRLSGIPVVGDMINARRTEGVQKFNSSAFDKALEPINAQVGDKVGEEAVDIAQQKVSDAFQAALGGKVAQADTALARQLTHASTQTLALPRVGKEVGDSIREILAPYMTGPQMTGEAMQQISRELRDLKAGYQTDPLKHRIGKAIDATEDAIFGLFKRQAPEVLPAYNAAKQAQRRVFILADAVNKAKNAEGVFTPAQLGMADRSNAIAYGSKLNAARGKGEFHDFQRAAQNVLPSKVPDSGTAGRVIIPALALGGGGAADQYGGTGGAGLTLGAILAGAYTKAGQRLLTKPARGASSAAGRAIGSETGRKVISAGGASSAAALTTQ